MFLNWRVMDPKHLLIDHFFGSLLLNAWGCWNAVLISFDMIQLRNVSNEFLGEDQEVRHEAAPFENEKSQNYKKVMS